MRISSHISYCKSSKWCTSLVRRKAQNISEVKKLNVPHTLKKVEFSTYPVFFSGYSDVVIEIFTYSFHNAAMCFNPRKRFICVITNVMCSSAASIIHIAVCFSKEKLSFVSAKKQISISLYSCLLSITYICWNQCPTQMPLLLILTFIAGETFFLRVSWSPPPVCFLLR